MSWQDLKDYLRDNNCVPQYTEILRRGEGRAAFASVEDCENALMILKEIGPTQGIYAELDDPGMDAQAAVPRGRTDLPHRYPSSRNDGYGYAHGSGQDAQAYDSRYGPPDDGYHRYQGHRSYRDVPTYSANGASYRPQYARYTSHMPPPPDYRERRKSDNLGQAGDRRERPYYYRDDSYGGHESRTGGPRRHTSRYEEDGIREYGVGARREYGSSRRHSDELSRAAGGPDRRGRPIQRQAPY
ncbi:unnamed protein product [Ostreobium quekettii]|uniref:Uncharacterized protein n=1 Tax=Ostreobium quekettii TaxID=121088 RepID=A0A8S1JEW3_9CHLO|nr:unnamed protein product [Ostreobium quekettii]